MSRPFRLLAVGAVVSLLSSGCALQNARYDYYSRAGTPFPDYDETIIDWNFPTSLNQGPLLAPERIRPTLPAIGVPWAPGGQPVPNSYFAPVGDASAAPAAVPDDATAAACDDACAAGVAHADAPADAQHDAGPALRLHEPVLSGSR